MMKRRLRKQKITRTKATRASKVLRSYLSYLIENKFEEALDHYSEAIFCKVPNKMKAVYYCNRALVNLKLENYAIALFGKF